MTKPHIDLLNFTNMSMGIETASDLVQYAVAYHLDTVAVCDFNTLQAFPELYRECKKHGVKAVYGVIFRVRAPKELSFSFVNVLCYAKNQQGLEALYHLYNRRIPQRRNSSYLELEDLLAYRQDLLLGVSPEYLEGFKYHQYDETTTQAVRVLTEKMFVPDFALIDSETKYLKRWEQAYAIFAEKQIPLCCTDNRNACILTDRLPLWMRANVLPLADRKHLRARFSFLERQTAEKAIDQSRRLVEQIDPRIEPLPRMLPDSQTVKAEIQMQEICLHQAEKVYGRSAQYEEIKERLINELHYISDKNLALRYRFAMETIRYCESKGETASVAASCCPLVSYLLGLTRSVGSTNHADLLPTLTMQIPASLKQELFEHLQTVFPEHQLLRVGRIRTVSLKKAIHLHLREFDEITPEEYSKMKIGFEALANTYTIVPGNAVLPIDRRNGEKVLHFDIRDWV